MVVQDQFFIAGIASGGLFRRKDRFDPAVAHGDGVALQNRARRLDGYDPAGAEEKAGCRVPDRKLLFYLGEPCTSTTTRRLGARHSISDLRSFWSGQDFDGSVLPKPNTSTLPASVPFDTR